MGVTIEANPSSNLLIADYSDLAQHPVFRLQPLPGAAAPEGEAVLVALGDDDPVTFATTLPEELAYLYATLVRRRVASPHALEAVDRLRANAWRARFTRLESADPLWLDWSGRR